MRKMLTAKMVAGLEAREGETFDLWDQAVPKMSVRVYPSGEKSWTVLYRVKASGKIRRYVVGTVGDVSLATARDSAQEVLGRVALGGDPFEEDKAARKAALSATKAPTMEKACVAFMAEEGPHLRLATRDSWERYINREIVPALGELRPELVTARDVAQLRARMEVSAPTSAKRCYEVLRRVFAWLVSTDMLVVLAREKHGIPTVTASPCVGGGAFRREKGGKARQAERPLTIEQTRAAMMLDPVLELVALTGVRQHDARAARFEQFDEARKLWTVPRHKTSDDTGLPHLVPLPAPALAVLAKAREANMAAGRPKSPWVFAAPTGECEVCGQEGHAGKSSKTAGAIKKTVGVTGRGLAHRLRHSIRTAMSEHGVPREVAELILAHKLADEYDASTLIPQRRAALEWWAGELTATTTKETKAAKA